MRCDRFLGHVVAPWGDAGKPPDEGRGVIAPDHIRAAVGRDAGMDRRTHDAARFADRGQRGVNAPGTWT